MAAAFSPQRNWFCPWLPHSKKQSLGKTIWFGKRVFFVVFLFWVFFKLASHLSVYEIHLPTEKKKNQANTEMSSFSSE